MKYIIVWCMFLNLSCYLYAHTLFTMNDSIRPHIELKEVVVRGTRISHHFDKVIVSVSRDVNKTGEELLQQVPSVTLTDKDIAINGMGGTKIFVDDREIKLSGEQLLSYLRSLSSKDILRIEVMNMSDVSNDADLKGGIIHIRLRHRSFDGIMGSIMLTSSCSPSLRGASLSSFWDAKFKRWSFFSNVTFTPTWKDKGNVGSDRVYHSLPYYFASDAHLSQPHYNIGIRSGIFYSIDTLRTIGASLDCLWDDMDIRTSNISSLSQVRDLFQSQGFFRQKIRYGMYDLMLNYVHKLDAQGASFQIKTNYVRKNAVNHDSYDINQLWNGTDTIYKNKLVSDYDVLSGDISYLKNLVQGRQWTLGVKYTMTNMNCHTHYQALHNDAWQDLSSFAYRLKYSEQIAAWYSSYRFTLDRFDISAGVRMEYTRTKDRTDGLVKHYCDWFPHLTLGYSFDDIKMWMISCQYARNIERPAFDALNPNRIQLSDYSYQIGNPNLRPTYIHKICATLIYNYRYTLSVGANLHTDLIREFGKQDVANSQVYYIQYENHHRENHWFVSLTTPFQPATWLNFSMTLTAVRQCIQMNRGEKYSNHHLLFANSTLGFLLPSDYSAEFFYSSFSRLYSGNSEVAPRGIINFKLNKKWVKSGLSFTLGIDNILDEGYRFRTNLAAYTTNSKSNLASNGRIFKFVLAWNFNRGKQIRKLQTESSSERTRF